MEGSINRRAGARLKQIRYQLELTIRQVESASRGIADAAGDRRYFISNSRLVAFENHGVVPSVFKLFSLSIIYDMPLNDILTLIGVDVGGRDRYRAFARPRFTQPIELLDKENPGRIPLRFDPGYSRQKTAMLNRMIQEWGVASVEFFTLFCRQIDFDRFLFVSVGQEDNLMHPLFPAGSIAKVDQSLTEIHDGEWLAETERPVYLVGVGSDFRLAWLARDESDLILLPHPLSMKLPERYSPTDNVQILGTVVGIWLTLSHPSVKTPAGPQSGTKPEQSKTPSFSEQPARKCDDIPE